MALGFKGCDGGFLSLLLALLFSLQQRPPLGRIFHLKSEQRRGRLRWPGRWGSHPPPHSCLGDLERFTSSSGPHCPLVCVMSHRGVEGATLFPTLGVWDPDT